MRRILRIMALLAMVHGVAALATAGTFRHNSLLKHYGPRGVYPAHFYDYYAPPTGYGRLGFMAYQGFGVGFNHYPYPYRAYYGGYGYGPYKTAEGRPLFNNYGYAYPQQFGTPPSPTTLPPIERATPALEDPTRAPNP